MGAQAIELELPTLEGAGGYAREMTEDRAARQRELLTPYIAAADALITTAAVPGRQAPLLVTTDMVKQMKPGSVVVDLAAESGGNVEGVVAGDVTQVQGVQLWGGANVPSQMPGPASRLYAQNVTNVILLMTREQRFDPDDADEIVAAMRVGGEKSTSGDFFPLLGRRVVENSSSVEFSPSGRGPKKLQRRRARQKDPNISASSVSGR